MQQPLASDFYANNRYTKMIQPYHQGKSSMGSDLNEYARKTRKDSPSPPPIINLEVVPISKKGFKSSKRSKREF